MSGLTAELLALSEAETVATRRLLRAVSTHDIDVALATLPANLTG
ncbi:hypothetical protein GCM10022254_39780 [Actinomadura meridiana]|uniref:Uncharacterized protein n=1 Tax=Actinomadura meridiana TaxID=559626 RepID=A0ABP8C6K1_9ACTN